MQKNKPMLYIMKGLPACGKSTKARAMVKKLPRTIRVNRDELRLMLHGGLPWSGKREKATVKARDTLIRTALRDRYNVICDDTNLVEKTVDKLKAIAVEESCKWEIVDLTDVDIQTCIDRDMTRTGTAHVGRDVILNMATTAGLRSQKKDYVIFDLDGTLADITHRRSMADLGEVVSIGTFSSIQLTSNSIFHELRFSEKHCRQSKMVMS